MPELTQSALCAMIDHTLLKPDSTQADLKRLCMEALEYKFASVCVLPYHVAIAHELLRDKIPVGTVIGFPLGGNRAEVKALEAVRAMADGATELDLVINIGAVKDKNWAVIENEISAVTKAAKGRPVKVILEISYLNTDEIKKLCQIAVENKAQFVKTSTGFSGSGATVESVRLMRQTVGANFGVKASGGIRTRAQALQMIEAGANRLGTSHGVTIVNEQVASGADY